MATATLLGLNLDISLRSKNLVLSSLLSTAATLLGLLGLSVNDSGLGNGFILIIGSLLGTSLFLLGGLLVRILGISQAMFLGRRGLLSFLGLGVRLVSHMKWIQNGIHEPHRP